MKLFSKRNKQALLIGIDGVPHSFLKTCIEKDVMPHLRRILTQGFTLHSMNASIPDVSSVSWTSFSTGVNPGEHGIYGFTELDPENYSLYFPNSRDVKAPPFWEILGKTSRGTSTLSGKYLPKVSSPLRSVIFNLPHTYPASPINGVLVSGFVAIDLKKAVYPEPLFQTLRSMNYMIDVDAEKVREDKGAFLKEIFACFEIRKKAIFHLFEKEPWDLFLACVTESDRLHHFFFDAAAQESHPDHGSFLNFYSDVDQFIGSLYDAFVEKSGGKGFCMILSDHGFAPIKKEVYINPYLQQSGLQELRPEGMFYERIGNQTRAFNLDPCRIYVNGHGLYGRGRVRREEKLQVLNEVREALQNLKTEEGEKVIDQIYQKEEIYRGPYLDRAPELVCLPRDGYDLKGGIEKKTVFGRTIFEGMHTWHDAFCVLPGGIRISKKPSIDQLAEYILRYFTE